METSIDGLIIKPLKFIKDERGAVMHMLKSDSSLFKKFGEVYFSLVNPGITKGWKRHKVMEQNFAVPIGEMRLIFVDSRRDSKTYKQRYEYIIGEKNYCLIQVPAMIWYCFTATGPSPALMANCATIVHDPLESETMDITLAPEL